MSRKTGKFQTDKFHSVTNGNFDFATHVHGWEPAVYMSGVKFSVCYMTLIYLFETFDFSAHVSGVNDCGQRLGDGTAPTETDV